MTNSMHRIGGNRVATYVEIASFTYIIDNCGLMNMFVRDCFYASPNKHEDKDKSTQKLTGFWLTKRYSREGYSS